MTTYGDTDRGLRAAARAIREHMADPKVSIELATARNPSGRLTTPEDVAKLLALLTDPRAAWLTGNTLGVDGGEDIVG